MDFESGGHSQTSIANTCSDTTPPARQKWFFLENRFEMQREMTYRAYDEDPLILRRNGPSFGASLPSNCFTIADDPTQLPNGLVGAVVAIGNFDGVHLGHLAVIRRAKTLAQRLGKPCAVLTFEPHPNDFFQGPNTVFRLTPRDAKAALVARLGVDGMIVMRFDATLAMLSAEAFVREVLVRQLSIAAVVAGYDFHFGKHRSGTPGFLVEAGARYGFAVEIVERITSDVSGSIDSTSSTAARKALTQGDVLRAKALLGYPYFVIGQVVQVEKRGASLGFCTGRLRLDWSNRLRHGVYAVEARVGEIVYGGLANYPSASSDSVAPLLQFFLFDFFGALYDARVEIAFRAFLRGDESDASPVYLSLQNKRDQAVARLILRR